MPTPTPCRCSRAEGGLGFVGGPRQSFLATQNQQAVIVGKVFNDRKQQ